MIHTDFRSGFLRFAQFLCLLLCFTLTNCKSNSTYPAAEGFDEKGSDKKAIEVADRMMEKLGGYKAFQNARFVAWTFFGQYQIWDKKNNLVRHELGNTVSLMNMGKRDGLVFVDGKRMIDTTRMYSKLSQSYIQFLSNSYFLFLPYKLKDAGVTLKYRGEGKTMNGKMADIIRLTFKEAGATPDNMHDLWVDKESGLPAQWAFYATRNDPAPAFVRLWADFHDYKGMKLALNRNSMQDTLTISHVVVTDNVPKDIFLSAIPVNKSQVK